jgi:hypothetical protein
MQKPKWEALARVKDKESTVGVYSLTKEDVISGLVVIVGNPKDFTIVNLAGEIDVTKLARINKAAGNILGLPEIINLDEMKLSQEEKKKQEEQKR